MGLWLVKTWLLVAHPKARTSDPSVTKRRWDLAALPDLYSWTINDLPPPSGLSVWLMKRHEGETAREAKHRLPLPVLHYDHQTIAFQSTRLGLRSPDISLVYHPGWEIEHPFESEGKAARLWRGTHHVAST